MYFDPSTLFLVCPLSVRRSACLVGLRIFLLCRRYWRVWISFPRPAARCPSGTTCMNWLLDIPTWECLTLKCTTVYTAGIRCFTALLTKATNGTMPSLICRSDCTGAYESQTSINRVLCLFCIVVQRYDQGAVCWSQGDISRWQVRDCS